MVNLNLSTVPEEVCLDTSMRRLILDGNALHSLPQRLKNLTSLETLSLRNNRFASIPPVLEQLPSLNHLVLGTNRLTSTEGLEKLPNLRVLDISGNQIEALPSSLSRLTNLVELDVGNNSLSEISRLALPKLKKLNLRGNKLKELGPDFVACASLQELRAGQNEISSLSLDPGKLTNLQQLLLGENAIQELPEGLMRLPALRKLVLTKNRITKIPHRIEGLSSLTELNLSANNISVLPSRLRKLPRLNYLGLQGNPLNGARAEPLPSVCTQCDRNSQKPLVRKTEREESFLFNRNLTFESYLCEECAKSGVRKAFLSNWLAQKVDTKMGRFPCLFDGETILAFGKYDLFVGANETVLRQLSCSGMSSEFDFLSNYHLLSEPLKIADEFYSSVEHFYQACKLPRESEVRRRIVEAATADEARQLARNSGRFKSKEQKIAVMKIGLAHKFMRPDGTPTQMGKLLLATGKRYLMEGNRRSDSGKGDPFFGVVFDEDFSSLYGANLLGRFLMEIRARLRGQA